LLLALQVPELDQLRTRLPGPLRRT
jgi:hypothetical protein